MAKTREGSQVSHWLRVQLGREGTVIRIMCETVVANIGRCISALQIENLLHEVPVGSDFHHCHGRKSIRIPGSRNVISHIGRVQARYREGSRRNTVASIVQAGGQLGFGNFIREGFRAQNLSSRGRSFIYVGRGAGFKKASFVSKPACNASDLDSCATAHAPTQLAASSCNLKFNCYHWRGTIRITKSGYLS